MPISSLRRSVIYLFYARDDADYFWAIYALLPNASDDYGYRRQRAHLLTVNNTHALFN